MIIHSNLTAAITRAGHTGTGPGQDRAKSIRKIVGRLLSLGQSAEITSVKGHAGVPGNERADALDGEAAEKTLRPPFTSWTTEGAER